MIKNFIKWGDTHPITYHAILFPPVGALGAWLATLPKWEDGTGLSWYWVLGASIVLTTGILISQEWSDERAKNRNKEHHKKTGFEGAEPWHGADWRDIVGGEIGGLIGSLAVLLIDV